MTIDAGISGMASLVSWYAVLIGLHWALLPVWSRVFAGLPDRGYSAGRTLGLLLAGWLYWTGWAYGLWWASVPAAWFCFGLIALASWAPRLIPLEQPAVLGGEFTTRTRRAEGNGFLPGRRVILVVEAVFLLAFTLMATLRSFLSGVAHTEQPSDLMFLNSIAAAGQFPAEDAWLSGFPVSYYYFGYWLQAYLGKLSAVPPTMVYDLGLATLFALLCTTCFGIGLNLALCRPPPNPSERAENETMSDLPIREGVFAGVVALAAVCLAGNLRSLYDLMAYARSRNDWWWLPSRAIQDLSLDERPLPLITEFPSFSYLLGDNHPHLHSAPLLLLLIMMLLGVLVRSRNIAAAGNPRWPLLCWRERLLIALLLGSLLATNTWDIVAGSLLLVASLLLFSTGQAPGDRKGSHFPLLRRLNSVGLEASAAGLLALALFAPHLLTADTAVSGILPNLLFPTRLEDFISAAGPGWLGVLLLVTGTAFPAVKSRLGPLIAGLVTAILLVALTLVAGLFWISVAPDAGPWLAGLGWNGRQSLGQEAVSRWVAHPFVSIALMIGAAGLLGSLGRAPDKVSTRSLPVEMASLLALCGTLLLVLPELVYVQDTFGYRVNTIFKLHYAAWPLLGLAGAFALVTKYPSRSLRILQRGVLVVVVLCLAYPIAAAISRIHVGNRTFSGLDDRAFLRSHAPDLARLVDRIDQLVPPGEGIVEAIGHREERPSSVLSTFTGRRTPLGWIDHEEQWRSRKTFARIFDERIHLVDSLYRSEDRESLQRALIRLGMEYVLVSSREEGLYGLASADNVFERECETRFASGGVRLFRCPARRSQADGGSR